MDTKLRKTILEFLYKENKKTSPYQIKKYCLSVYNVSDKDFEQKNELASKINHLTEVLRKEGLADYEEYQSGQLTGCDIWLTAEGYKEFDPWYKKIWYFFQGPFITILTIINTLISIAAIIVGWIILSK